nr:hypothetical protein [Tanacetum cinerariifolium]
VGYKHVVLASTCHRETATTVRKPVRMAALAVPITGASQSRQHGKSELVIHLNPSGNTVESSTNMVECAVTELVKLISAHQTIFLFHLHRYALGIRLVILSSNSNLLQMTITEMLHDLEAGYSDNPVSGVDIFYFSMLEAYL